MFNIPIQPKTWYKLIRSGDVMWNSTFYIYNDDGIEPRKMLAYIKDGRYLKGYLTSDSHTIENVDESFHLSDFENIKEFFQNYYFTNIDLSSHNDLIKELVKSNELSNYLIAYEMLQNK